jgi:hemerythrin
MTHISWSDRYALQVAILDQDHQQIVGAINALQDTLEAGAIDDRFDLGLRRLQGSIQEHFEREEALMREHDYPYHGAHREQHRLLNRDVYAVRKLHGVDREAIDLGMFLAFLNAWWHQHLLKGDAIFASYLKRKGEGEASGAAPERAQGLRGLAESADDVMRIVSVQVPESAVDAIYTCARLLRRGGDEAATIRKLADPLATMTLDEAAIIAKGLMR